jgi:predicted AlkP superfamily phosphohydrolase/phosphomutase
MGREVPLEKTWCQLRAIREEIIVGARLKGELSRWLLETNDWDFFLTVFAECHRGGHLLYHDPDDEHPDVPEDALLGVYQAVDVAVGRLLEGLDLSSILVIVFSLHGMGPDPSQWHFVRPVMERVNTQFMNSMPKRGDSTKSLGGIIRLLREKVPVHLQHAIAQALPIEVRDWVVARDITGGIDWDRTPGFALLSDLQGYLRLNLAGREAKGMLEKGSSQHKKYERLVKESFLGLRVADSNLPLVKEIVRPADIFPGPRSGYLPDMVVTWNDLKPAKHIYSDQLGSFHAELGSGRGGNHKPDGFAVVLGEGSNAINPHPLKDIIDLSCFVKKFVTEAS